MRGIISGFNSFGQHEHNPTQDLVEGLPDAIDTDGNRITLDRVLLDSCCDHAWEALRQMVQTGAPKPSFVILTGLAENRSCISLERFALNIQDYRIPDNSGHQWQDRRLDDSGPEALRTQISLIKLRDELQSKGAVCEVSNHAGTFLCNEVFYRTLRWMELRKLPQHAIFVHFPPPLAYMAQLSARGPSGGCPADTAVALAQALDEYRQVVLHIARFAARAALGAGPQPN